MSTRHLSLARRWCCCPARLSGAGRRDRRPGRHHGHEHDGPRLSPTARSSSSRTSQFVAVTRRGPVLHHADQPVGHGEPDPDRCAQAGLAKRITVVAPYYPYARQDKKHRGREPISARLMGRPVQDGRRRPVDGHRPAHRPDPGLLRRPVDHLFALPLLADYVKEKYPLSG